MCKKNGWLEFFDNHAPVYMDQWYTQGTIEDVDFLLEALNLPVGSHILDVGCGTGRHAVELAKRGYQVAGVDFSLGMLAEAEKAAREAGVKVEWIHADATQFQSAKTYDAAICMLEAAFGLHPTDGDPMEHDLAILRNVHTALRPGARFMLHATNGFKRIREIDQERISSGNFDPVTMLNVATLTWDTPEGKKQVHAKIKSWVPPELGMILRTAGFEVEHIWSGNLGLGPRKIQLDDYMIMVVARKETVGSGESREMRAY